MILYEWARQWGVPAAAMADLRNRVLVLDGGVALEVPAGRSEAAVQAALRVRASKLGLRLWRNNVGALRDERGAYVRFGLANDSAQLNAVIKSADLIGIRPRIIQPGDVGQVIGQFLSREVKHEGWRYGGTEREVAQANWAMLVNTLGGDASFATSESHV